MSQVEWKEVSISDICLNVYSGGTPKSSNSTYYGGNIPWLKTKEVNFCRIYQTENFITQDGYDNSSAKWVPENAVIVAMYGATAGRVAITKIKLTTNQACCNLVVNPSKADYNYVYYFLLHNYSHIASMANGGAQQNLNAGQIKDYKIPLPPLEEQKRIAGILGSLDDKIELNNKINDNLEKQAQALFKNWFIDYAPFGGEELIDSPIEIKVPKSLKMIQVNDYPHIIETGRRPKGGAVGEGIPSIGAENVKELGVFDYSSNKFIPREFAETLGEKGKINGYELLLYKDGGKPGTFMPHFSMFGEGYPYEECYINEHVFKVDFGDKALNIFAYFYFQTEYVIGWLANNGGKAAIPGINQNDVNAVWIYNLNNPKVKEFGEIVKPMFEQILKNCKQNRELSIMRDALLPKLMMDKII